MYMCVTGYGKEGRQGSRIIVEGPHWDPAREENGDCENSRASTAMLGPQLGRAVTRAGAKF